MLMGNFLSCRYEFNVIGTLSASYLSLPLDKMYNHGNKDGRMFGALALKPYSSWYFGPPSTGKWTALGTKLCRENS